MKTISAEQRDLRIAIGRFMRGKRGKQSLRFASDSCGVSVDTIRAIEGGKTVPSLPAAFNWSEVFGFNFNEFAKVFHEYNGTHKPR